MCIDYFARYCWKWETENKTTHPVAMQSNIGEHFICLEEFYLKYRMEIVKWLAVM